MISYITFNEKFTSKDLREFIQRYWDLSFRSKAVEFDLAKLEWISNEEIAFWFGWIYQLTEKGIYVRIKMQDGKSIDTTSTTYKRRQRALSSLVYRSGLYEKFHQKIYDEKGNSLVAIEEKHIAASMRFMPKYEENLIPFYKIKANAYQSINSSEEFDIEQKTMFLSYPIEETISNSLKNESLNYIDNYILSYIIPKELYTNSCQHAYETNTDLVNECYLNIGYEKKITGIKDAKLLLSLRANEKTKEEFGFYKFYQNRSFLTLTFLDFGQGIPKSLNAKYLADIGDNNQRERLAGFFSPDHFSQTLDCRIIEYALLLYTSCNELERNLEFHDFIPRGLFVIKDIVKRNNGLLVIRSGTGRVIFDFSSSQTDLKSIVKYKQNDAVVEFPGTMISIVLPSAEENQTITNENVIIGFQPNEFPFQRVSLLNLYLKSIDKLGANASNVTVTKYIFNDISKLLLELNQLNVPQNVLFDYAGLDIKKYEFAKSLFYYLTLTSLINDQIHALIINVIDNRILLAYVNLFSSLQEESNVRQQQMVPNIKQEEVKFLQKTIPCVYANCEVSFVGNDDDQFSDMLKELWINNTAGQFNTFSPSLLKLHFSTQSTYGKSKFLIEINLPSYDGLLKAIRHFNKEFVNKELNNQGLHFEDLAHVDDKSHQHNYNHILHTAGANKWYLTTNGKYQKEFISFIEKLYKKQYRQLLATFLVFAFFSDEENQLKKSGVTKILTVTLSSQLLGKEVKEIFDSLKQDNVNSRDKKELILIPLSSYYDFEQEEPFKEIGSGDLVLVVNDVVSTGSLSNKIFNSITSSKIGAKIAGVLTVVDSRDNRELYPTLNNIVVNLTERRTKQIDSLPIDSLEPIWISPLVNAPITMKRTNSVDLNILFDVDDFLSLIDSDELVAVGHIKHNTLHHTYYINASELYKQDRAKGYPLFKKLFSALDEKKRLKDQFKVVDKVFLIKKSILALQGDIINLTESIDKQRANALDKIPYRNLDKQIKDLSDISQKLESKLTGVQDGLKQVQDSPELNLSIPNFDIDFVFVPFLSSAMNIIEDLPKIYREVNKNKSIEVYPIPRIMTPKGWRFTFPPKFLNKLTKESRVFILDDGSWTGETLIQMIDSICFLSVSEILVLSIIARFDDYQREFLSRLQRIKTKHDEIPINIFFGTHLHIPIYNSDSDNCPFISEQKELEKIAEINRQKSIEQYINERIQQIKYVDNTVNASINDPTSIPENISRRDILWMRNFIGKYEGFRLYEDDVTDVLKSNAKLSSNPDVLLAIILHEPYLVQIIRRIDISANALNNLTEFVSSIIFDGQQSLWKKTSILKALFILSFNEFIKIDSLKKILYFCNDERQAVNCLSYLLFKSVQIPDDSITPSTRMKIVAAIKEVFDWIKMDKKTSEILDKVKSNEYEAFRQLLNQVKILPITESTLVQNSFALSEFYRLEITEGKGHESMAKNLRLLMTQAYNYASDFENKIDPIHLWDDTIKPIFQSILNQLSQLKSAGLFDDASLQNITTICFGDKKSKFDENWNEKSLIFSIERIDHLLQKVLTTKVADLIKGEATYLLDMFVAPTSRAAKFFANYPSSFRKIWKRTFEDFEETFDLKNVIIRENQNDDDIIVAIHEGTLEKILSNFFQNFCDHLKDYRELVVTVKDDKEYLICEVSQNQQFEINTPNGLGITRIEKLLAPYNGSFIYPTKKDIKQSDLTTLTIKIPIYE